MNAYDQRQRTICDAVQWIDEPGNEQSKEHPYIAKTASPEDQFAAVREQTVKEQLGIRSGNWSLHVGNFCGFFFCLFHPGEKVTYFSGDDRGRPHAKGNSAKSGEPQWIADISHGVKSQWKCDQGGQNACAFGESALDDQIEGDT